MVSDKQRSVLVVTSIAVGTFFWLLGWSVFAGLVGFGVLASGDNPNGPQPSLPVLNGILLVSLLLPVWFSGGLAFLLSNGDWMRGAKYAGITLAIGAGETALMIALP